MSAWSALAFDLLDPLLTAAGLTDLALGLQANIDDTQHINRLNLFRDAIPEPGPAAEAPWVHQTAVLGRAFWTHYLKKTLAFIAVALGIDASGNKTQVVDRLIAA